MRNLAGQRGPFDPPTVILYYYRIMSSLKLPPHWAHVTLVALEHPPIMGVDRAGESYVKDSRGPAVLVLRCDCGHEWETPAATFPGRRYVQSCHQPGCKFAPHPKPLKRVKEPRSNICVSVTTDLITQIHKYAKEHSLTASRAVEVLVMEGLIAKLINE